MAVRYWDSCIGGDEFYTTNFGFCDNDERKQVPIIYSRKYNIKFGGFENLHPFDSKKYARVVRQLIDSNVISSEGQLVAPQIATEQTLRLVHTESYLNSMRSSVVVAKLAEFPPVALFPSCVTERAMLRPMRTHVGGTILAGKLALDYGWSINLGGGMHHAHADGGGGWCLFSDIPLSYEHLKLAYPDKVKKVMIIDTDVHQGNGLGRDKLRLSSSERESGSNNRQDSSNTFILDCYRGGIYPGDDYAKRAIDEAVVLRGDETDETYNAKLKRGLDRAFAAFQPDIVYYNAGTDPLVGDPLGGMSITPAGIVARDEMVWREAIKRDVPIAMVLSGGYTKPLSAQTVAQSIINLDKEFYLTANALSSRRG